jgi:hypothetical protein
MYLTYKQALDLITGKDSDILYARAYICRLIALGKIERVPNPKLYIKTETGEFKPVDVSTEPLVSLESVEHYKANKQRGRPTISPNPVTVIFSDDTKMKFASPGKAATFLRCSRHLVMTSAKKNVSIEVPARLSELEALGATDDEAATLTELVKIKL